MKRICTLVVLAVLLCLAAEPSFGAIDADKLAKDTQNPVAKLASVPYQSNWDFGNGQMGKTSYLLNFQPIVPFTVNKDWNLITRTIVPVESAPPLVPRMKRENGLGDITPTLFFSPNPKGHFMWGAGPVFLFPSATSTELGSGKVGIGPSVVLVDQPGHWTYGILFNHILSFAGKENRTDVSKTLLEPFIAYGFPHGVTLTLESETYADWKQKDSSNRWTVPLNLILSKVMVIGKQPVSLGIGTRYYTDKPELGPDWGVRAVVTFLFPEK